MTKTEQKTDEKQDAKATKTLTPRQLAMFRKRDARHDAKGLTRAADEAEDKRLVAAIKKGK